MPVKLSRPGDAELGAEPEACPFAGEELLVAAADDVVVLVVVGGDVQGVPDPVVLEAAAEEEDVAVEFGQPGIVVVAEQRLSLGRLDVPLPREPKTQRKRPHARKTSRNPEAPDDPRHECKGYAAAQLRSR